jgi:hypothetical protein
MSPPRLWPLTDCTTNYRHVLPWERVEYFHRNPCDTWEVTEREPSSLRRNVMYGYESSATLTTDRLHYKSQSRPLVREGVPRRRAQELSGKKKAKWEIWSWAPKGCPTPRWISRLTVGHNINSRVIIQVTLLSSIAWHCNFCPSEMIPGVWTESRDRQVNGSHELILLTAWRTFLMCKLRAVSFIVLKVLLPCS